ncbi:MAG: Spx/MgsR family RNA polymerase-binding regulatory protein [Bacteroidales bacterium]|nr:Spx/MgsR family RNA polymerase-binding regulatory protein [Bacteroidales bacterium]
MKPLLLYYPNCDTSRKAAKWLSANHFEVEKRDIVLQNPTAQELSEWIVKSKKPISKFFNTSGIRYKELHVKDKIKTAGNDELIALLASEGKLVKRPLLITGNTLLIGFKEDEWAEALLSQQK